MESFFTKLKEARESKGFSLDDVSSATNINVDFLGRLERGETDMLPQVYIRAFLREYASVIGWDPDETLREYESIAKPEPTGESHEKETTPTSPTASSPGMPATEKLSLGRPATIAVGVTVVALIVILYWNLSRPAHETTITPSTGSDETAIPEKIPSPLVQKHEPVAESDSLTLVGRTSDSVWIMIVVDSRDSLEHLMRPGVTRTWKAQNSFRVSLGRPDAISFTLNGISLGTLGARDRIVRDSLITRQTLSRSREQD